MLQMRRREGGEKEVAPVSEHAHACARFSSTVGCRDVHCEVAARVCDDAAAAVVAASPARLDGDARVARARMHTAFSLRVRATHQVLLRQGFAADVESQIVNANAWTTRLR